MKLPVNKERWQFWLPKYVDIDEEVVRSAVLPSQVDRLNNSDVLVNRGRVVKSTSKAEYSPEPKTGGRVVKIMPRQLKQIKEAQEKLDD